jgi:hypothetical protein
MSYHWALNVKGTIIKMWNLIKKSKRTIDLRSQCYYQNRHFYLFSDIFMKF